MLARYSTRRLSLICNNQIRLHQHSNVQPFLFKAFNNSLPLKNSYANVPPKSLNPSNTTTNSRTKNDDSGERKSKKIQAMPSRLTKLISDVKDGGWPSLANMSLLCQKCELAGVDINQVEEFLIGHFRKKSKGHSTSRESNFYSKHLLERWTSDKQNETLERFFQYFEANIYGRSEKQGLPIR